MKKLLACVLVAASLLTADGKKPKLVLAIVVDQFRYDYLTRYRGEYHGGLNRLLTEGAVFTNAHYQQFPTVTAVGHSTFLYRRHARAQRHHRQRLVRPRGSETGHQRLRSRTQLLGGQTADRLLAAAHAGGHGGRRVEDGRQQPVARDRHLAQGPRRHSSGGPHGRRRLLVRHHQPAASSAALIISPTCPVGPRNSIAAARPISIAALPGSATP